MNIPARFLVDQKGRKKSVVLQMRDYAHLMQYMEDLEDSMDLKKAKKTAQGFITLKQLESRLKK